MTTLRVLGVDPGARTGLALVEREVHGGERITRLSVVIPDRPSGILSRTGLVIGPVDAVYLETWPTGALRSGKAVAGLYRIAGRCEEAFGPLARGRVQHVYAQWWRSALGIKHGTNKAGVAAYLGIRFPGLYLDPDAADALGIALYGIGEEAVRP